VHSFLPSLNTVMVCVCLGMEVKEEKVEERRLIRGKESRVF